MELADRTPEPDRDAFDRMVAAHYGAVSRLVFRLLGWRDGGEDVVQEVFLSAWASWPRLSRPAGVEFWLKRIAVNKCRSRMRRLAVHARWLKWFHAVLRQDERVASEDSLTLQERSVQVRGAIQSLDPNYREVIVLFYMEQMSVDEIAQLARERRNTIEVRLHRARRRLEQLLADLME